MTMHSNLAAPAPLAALARDDRLPDDIRALLAGDGPSEAAIATFLAARPFPHLAPGRALFAFHGTAHSVDLVRWIHAGIDRVPFVPVPGSDLWLLAMPVEDGGRFEYKLALAHDGHEEWLLDPLNPNTARDPFGENSVCTTYGYQRPDWTLPQGAPAGRIETVAVESPTFGETRHEHIYLPPGDIGAIPLPLAIIHDGDDFVTYADLAVTLDNLIAAGDIPPLIAALVQTGDRMGEYPRGRRHARYLARELLPTLAAHYRVSERPAERVLLGASLGAVASLATAFRFPGVFGGLVLKSGSFILDPAQLHHREHPVFHRIARLVAALKRAPDLKDTRAFVSTGELEGLAGENRALATFLEHHGVAVRFQSSWDGHHWHNWRDQLRDGLMWVFDRTHNKT